MATPLLQQGSSRDVQPVPPDELPPLSEEQRAKLHLLLLNKDRLDPEQRVIVEELAKQRKFEALHEGITERPSTAKEQYQAMARAVKESILPVAGQMAGAVIGRAIPGAGSAVSRVIGGETVGALGGVEANRQFGISDPGALDYLMSGAVPALSHVALKGVRRMWPGGEAAEQQLAIPKLGEVSQVMSGPEASPLYERLAKGQDFTFANPSFREAISKLAKTEESASKYGLGSAPIKRMTTKAERAMEGTPGEMSFNDSRVILKRLREKADAVEQKGGEVWGAYKHLRGQLYKDINELAKTSTEAQTLKQAASNARREIAQDELVDVLTKYGTKWVTVGGQTFQIIQPTKVLNKLKDMNFTESAGKDWPKIEGMLKDLAKVPTPTGTEKVALGSPGRVMATGGAGAATALGFGAGSLATAGGAAAAIASYEAIARLSMSDKGRNLLVSLFKANEGRVSERTATILQFAVSQVEPPTQEAPRE